MQKTCFQGVLLEIHFLDNDVQPIVFVMPGKTTVLCCILQKLEHQPFWRTARLKSISMQLCYAHNELPKCWTLHFKPVFWSYVECCVHGVWPTPFVFCFVVNRDVWLLRIWNGIQVFRLWRSVNCFCYASNKAVLCCILQTFQQQALWQLKLQLFHMHLRLPLAASITLDIFV